MNRAPSFPTTKREELTFRFEVQINLYRGRNTSVGSIGIYSLPGWEGNKVGNLFPIKMHAQLTKPSLCGYGEGYHPHLASACWWYVGGVLERGIWSNRRDMQDMDHKVLEILLRNHGFIWWVTESLQMCRKDGPDQILFEKDHPSSTEEHTLDTSSLEPWKEDSVCTIRCRILGNHKAEVPQVLQTWWTISVRHKKDRASYK